MTQSEAGPPAASGGGAPSAASLARMRPSSAVSPRPSAARGPGLKDPNRPIGSFIFLGPTGVGKTELCQRPGRGACLGDEDSVIRVGHVRVHGETHHLAHDRLAALATSATRKAASSPRQCAASPTACVLLDEVEKAHPGRVQRAPADSGGWTASRTARAAWSDFKNTVVVMTSNAGAHSIDSGSAPWALAAGA